MRPIHVALVVGTRPEAIKMAPVLLALRADARFRASLVATGQHRELLDGALGVFGLTPDVDLGLMDAEQTLADLTARVITHTTGALADLRPDAVLVHGDTTTCLGAALAAFYQEIPVGHVEAGLRTHDMSAPWPEEMNRRLVDPLCRWCFAPTARAAENLGAEGIDPDCVEVTGNTVIDALHLVRQGFGGAEPQVPGLPDGALDGKRLILVTGHRRESFGPAFRDFSHALGDLAAAREDVAVVYPVHLNPNVQRPVHEILGGQERVHLVEPLDYVPFLALMDRCHLIITDSGGIQEEAPAFGKPVLVTRETTERPEALAAGTARLVGTSRGGIVAEAMRLLDDDAAYGAMVAATNPFGDGQAAARITARLAADLGDRP